MPSGVNLRVSRCVRIRNIRSVSLRDARREDRVIEISDRISTAVFNNVLVRPQNAKRVETNKPRDRGKAHPGNLGFKPREQKCRKAGQTGRSEEQEQSRS